MTQQHHNIYIIIIYLNIYLINTLYVYYVDNKHIPYHNTGLTIKHNNTL